MAMSTLVQTPELHQLSIDEYHRLVACGGFDEDARVELIDGLIVDVSPKTPEHENTVQWLVDWLIRHLDHTDYQLRVSAPITIGSSEPEPDLAIVRRAEPTEHHPSQALLVIEVAVTSSDRDLGVKPGLYADAVDEYWVVDLQARRVVVHRDPVNGAYRETGAVRSGDQLTATAVDLGELPTDDLFAAAFAEPRRHSA
jgi:Uma2 family endonuclease